MATYQPSLEGVEITEPVTAEFAEILTPDAIYFVATLVRAFADRREELLKRRAQRQAELNAGKLPDFLPEMRTAIHVDDARVVDGLHPEHHGVA